MTEFTHPYQTKVNRILPADIHTQLCATPCGSTVINYIERVANQAYNNYVELRNLRRTFKKYEKFWHKFYVTRIDTCNITESTDVSQHRINILLNKLVQYRDFLNHSVDNWIDISSKFIRVILKKDQLLSKTIYDEQSIKFVQIHNRAMKSLEKNIKCGISNAIECVIKYTTQSQYKFWRRKVCS